MSKKMLIDATHPEETRVVVADGNRVEDFDFESENKRQLAGNIYLAKVTRVEPSLQAAFVDYGGNRHGFLAFSEIHPDYYQIPIADREALMAEEAALAAEAEREEEKPQRRRRRSRAEAADEDAEHVTADDAGGTDDDEARARTIAIASEIPGMDVVDLADDDGGDGGDGGARNGDDRGDAGETGDDTPYRAMDDAADRDSSIESVADDDDADDVRPARKPRARRYKIQEVVKVRQIMLVQVVKEERGNKGAALTTYLSLAGRYCVLMPNTARGGGISRKITNAPDRKKLKQIAAEIDVPRGAGLIIRTAGAKRTKTEIRRDYEYLQRLWEQIRELTLKSVAPTKIYEEGDLIKRSIRDLYSREIDEVLVEGAEGYKTAKTFMKMIMPSHAKNVKLYHDGLPLFARHQVESYLGSMFNPTVQLKSGGYIVIGVTEALVAIDVNSGRSTREGSIEETALKTNLEAAEEIARQLRLRDLAGLIVVDFIDMEERRNNAAVEKRFKDKLKVDRARIQVGRISGFGLLEMSRQRLRPGMLEATTQPCSTCHGTGLIRSDDSVALMILRQLEEEGTKRKAREILVMAPVAIANFLMNQKREHVAGIEGRYGMAVRIEGEPTLVSPDFSFERFKTQQTRSVEATPHVVSVDASLMQDIDDATEAEAEDEVPEVEETAVTDAEPVEETRSAGDDDGGAPRKRRRRRRRRRGGDGADRAEAQAVGGDARSDGSDAASGSDDAPDTGEASVSDATEASETEDEGTPRRRRSSRSRTRGSKRGAAVEASDPATADGDGGADTRQEPGTEEAPREAGTAEPVAAVGDPTPTTVKVAPKDSGERPGDPAHDDAAAMDAESGPRGEPAPPEAEPQEERAPPQAEPQGERAQPKAEPQPEPVGAEAAEEREDRPRRRGWWSFGR
jgi:ribonuclease E